MKTSRKDRKLMRTYNIVPKSFVTDLLDDADVGEDNTERMRDLEILLARVMAGGTKLPEDLRRDILEVL